MRQTAPLPAQYDADRAETLRNRERLSSNRNLLYWYRELYREQFRDFPAPNMLRILEVGSGVSPLRQFYPDVVTSDVLELDYLDHVFDCHDIDQIVALPEESFDVITLTNVLHHLKSPLEFLRRAASKLKRGGKLIATEPFFSFLSTPIFKYLHHEPVDFSISKPELADVHGPLASANIAIPWLIFIARPQWGDSLRELYKFDDENMRPFSSLSYMATGGISRRIPISSSLYRLLFRLDLKLSRVFPKAFASFFTVLLTRR